MSPMARAVFRRVVVIGVVLIAAGTVGYWWLPLLATVAFIAAANERLVVWTQRRADELEPHRGADDEWADQLHAFVHQPLAIEAVKVHTGELEQAVREWSGAT